MHCHLIALVLIASTAVLVEIKCQTTNIITTLLETSSTLGTSDGKLGGSCTWQQQFSLQAFILIVLQCCFCFCFFFAFFPPCNIQKYIAALRDHSQMDGSMPLRTFRWECQRWAGPSFIAAIQIWSRSEPAKLFARWTDAGVKIHLNVWVNIAPIH